MTWTRRRRLADRLCILHRGRTLQTGLVREILTRPANSEVARLLDMHNREIITLGDFAHVFIQLDDIMDSTLLMILSVHVAQRNQLEVCVPNCPLCCRCT